MNPNIPKTQGPELIPDDAVAKPTKVFITRTLLKGVIPTWGDVKAAESVLAEVQAEAVLLNPPIAEPGETNA